MSGPAGNEENFTPSAREPWLRSRGPEFAGRDRRGAKKVFHAKQMSQILLSRKSLDP